METEHHFAGLKPRAAAVSIDFLILAAYAGVLFIVGWILRLMTSVNQRMDSAFARDFVAFITLILTVVLYFSLQESSARQATIGKQKIGLQVINAYGRRLSNGQALLRSGLKFLLANGAYCCIPAHIQERLSNHASHFDPGSRPGDHKPAVPCDRQTAPHAL